MSENQTRPTAASVDAFLDGVENATRRDDSRQLLPMFERIVGEPATMWGPAIVGFGKYHYEYASGREGDAPLAAFSPRKNDLTVYVNAKLLPLTGPFTQLGKHKSSVSCLYLKRLADADLAVLEAIVTESVRLTRQQYGD